MLRDTVSLSTENDNIYWNIQTILLSTILIFSVELAISKIKIRSPNLSTSGDDVALNVNERE